METYRYLAMTQQGAETRGIIEAASRDEALQMLRDRDLRDIQVMAWQEDASQPQLAPISLSSGEAAELSQQVAQVSAAQLPLAAGLRAAAEETASRRVAKALQWMAGQVDLGRDLQNILTQSGNLLPAHITGLMLAAARTGNFGEALFELVELQQKTYALRREMASGYAYPLVVLIIAVSVVVGFAIFLTGTMRQMFDEFRLELPLATRVLFWWRDVGIWIMVGVLTFFAAAAVLYRLLGGRARWCALLSTVPLFGPLRHWTGVAEWSGLVSVLLRHHVPLPESLRWAGRGTRDAYVGQLSQRLADGVARGRTLSQMLSAMPELPRSIAPMIAWGEMSDALPDAFQVSQEMLEKRATTRAALLQFVIPPLLFLGIGSVILFVVAVQFVPLITLISRLSSS